MGEHYDKNLANMTSRGRCPETGKVSFIDRKDARRVAKDLRRQHGSTFRPYECQHCGSIHLYTVSRKRKPC